MRGSYLLGIILAAACGGNDAPQATSRAKPFAQRAPAPSPPATQPATQPDEPPGPAPESYSWAPNPPPTAPPAEVASKVALERVARGLDRPLQIVSPRDGSGRLFIVEQGGRILIMRGGEVDRKQPFADLSKLVTRGHNEQGLLGLVFHPKFADNGKLYVNYTARKTGTTHVVEYRVSQSNPDRLDPDTARVLLTVKQPWGNHNAGDLQFGPDGKLYVGTGDGGAANDPLGSGQDDDSLLAKMIRLDVDAAEPTPEIIQKGLRNPWRYAFDRKTGDLYIGDVGQNKYEEIAVVPGGDYEGHNFGWNITEGFHCFRDDDCNKSDQVPPAVEFDHTVGCSITGGFVYRGKAIPALDGAYFYADYCTAVVRSFRWNAGEVTDHWEWRPVLDPESRLASLSSFGEDADGELYLISLDGAIYKFVPRD